MSDHISDEAEEGEGAEETEGPAPSAPSNERRSTFPGGVFGARGEDAPAAAAAAAAPAAAATAAEEEHGVAGAGEEGGGAATA